jgi:hypothetical protein
LRTPNERPARLPNFPFAPHYVEVNGSRVRHLDKGFSEINFKMLVISSRKRKAKRSPGILSNLFVGLPLIGTFQRFGEVLREI